MIPLPVEEGVHGSMIGLAVLRALKVKVCFRCYHGMNVEVFTTIRVYLLIH